MNRILMEETSISITGDDTFPLSQLMMKSHPQRNLTVEKSIFGYCLSRIRKISEK